jgi:hypothetical protein
MLLNWGDLLSNIQVFHEFGIAYKMHFKLLKYIFLRNQTNMCVYIQDSRQKKIISLNRIELFQIQKKFFCCFIMLILTRRLTDFFSNKNKTKLNDKH